MWWVYGSGGSSLLESPFNHPLVVPVIDRNILQRNWVPVGARAGEIKAEAA